MKREIFRYIPIFVVPTALALYAFLMPFIGRFLIGHLLNLVFTVGMVGAAQTMPWSWCKDDRPVPMIDFDKKLAVILIVPGPNKISVPELSIDDTGNVRVPLPVSTLPDVRWIGANVDVNLGRSWYALLSGTRDGSGADLTNQIYAGLVLRF